MDQKRLFVNRTAENAVQKKADRPVNHRCEHAEEEVEPHLRLSEFFGAVPACWTSHSSHDAKNNKIVIFEYYEPPVSF